MHYRSEGKGAPVVLVHGFCETGELWNGFSAELSAEYEVLIPDLPGFGQSGPLVGEFQVSDVADYFYQWLTSLEKGKVTVIGHSLGGYITLELAKRHPQVLQAIGLFHSTALPDPEEKKATRNKVIEFVRENGVELFADSFVPQLFYAANRDRLANEVKNAVNIAAQTPPDTLIQYTRAMRDRADRTDVLASGLPVLFIAGSQDLSVPIERSEQQIPMIKDGEAYVLKNTAHMGMFEAYDETLGMVRQFLRKVVG